MNVLRTIAVTTMCVIAQSSVAAEQGFYFGLNAGQAKYDFAYRVPAVPQLTLPGGSLTPVPFNPFPRLEESLIATNPGASFREVPSSIVAGGAVANVMDFPQVFWIPRKDDDANAWGGFVGYRAFRYAAVELAYAHLGTLHEYQPEVRGTNFILPAVESDLESSGPQLSALAILPLSERWELYLRGGVLFVDQKVTHASSITRDATTYGSDDLLFGAGVQFDVASHWTMRLDFQRYDDVGEDDWIGEADIDVWSLGVLFRL